MPLFSRSTIGLAGFERLIREGVLVPVAGPYARPADIPESRDDRALALSLAVPKHVVLSGRAGLWVHGNAPVPTRVDVVGSRGLHRFKPGAGPRGFVTIFHSGAAASEPAVEACGIRIASVERCATDALRWSGVEDVAPHVSRAIKEGAVCADRIDEMVAQIDLRGSGAARVVSTWTAMKKTLPQ